MNGRSPKVGRGNALSRMFGTLSGSMSSLATSGKTAASRTALSQQNDSETVQVTSSRFPGFAREVRTVPAPISVAAAASAASNDGRPIESVGVSLRTARQARGMSLAEVARITRIPQGTLGSIEADHFDDLPGEVFVRGFLRSFALAIRLSPDDILARYTQSRRPTSVMPVPLATQIRPKAEGSRRFGIAIACVLLLILFTLAVSIVLKPRGHDVPSELSMAPHEMLDSTFGI